METSSQCNPRHFIEITASYMHTLRNVMSCALSIADIYIGQDVHLAIYHFLNCFCEDLENISKKDLTDCKDSMILIFTAVWKSQ